LQDLYIFGGITGIGGLFAIFARRLADHPKFGRKYSLLLFLIISFSGAILTFFIYNLILNIIATFIISIFMINTGSLLLAEEVPAKYRGRAAGIVSAVGMSSSIFASFLSTQFYLWPEHAWQHFFLIVMASGIIIIIVMSFWIKETRRFTLIRTENNKTKVKLHDIFNKKTMKPLILVSLLVFFMSWIYMTIKGYFQPYLVGIGFTYEIIGTLGMIAYPGSIIGYFLSGILSDHLGRRNIIILAMGIYFIGTLSFLFTTHFAFLALGFFLINMTWGIFWTTTELLSVEFFDTNVRGTTQGIAFTFSTVSFVIGGFIMAEICKIFGWFNLFFWLGTLSIFAIVITCFFLPETKGKVLEEISNA